MTSHQIALLVRFFKGSIEQLAMYSTTKLIAQIINFAGVIKRAKYIVTFAVIRQIEAIIDNDQSGRSEVQISGR